MPDGSAPPRREPEPEPGNDGTAMVEEYLDCRGRMRRFRLESYGGGQFLSGTEILSDESSGMRLVRKADADGHLPWGELRQQLRRRLAERDVALTAERDRPELLHDRVRAQIVDFNDQEPLLVVDDMKMTWSELGAMLSAHEGFALELRILDGTEV